MKHEEQNVALDSIRVKSGGFIVFTMCVIIWRIHVPMASLPNERERDMRVTKKSCKHCSLTRDQESLIPDRGRISYCSSVNYAQDHFPDLQQNA